MKKGKIIAKNTDERYAHTKGNFSIDFDHSSFGPYNYLFQRENLYFHEGVDERGSFFFPFENKSFKNTEIFLETDDIVIGVGTRGSFSGKEKTFIEIINLKTHQKYRLYPDEVSLIYNSKQSIIIYYKKSQYFKRLELTIKTLEKNSETSMKVDAFFKLLFNYKTKEYLRLIYHRDTHPHKVGYFIEELIDNSMQIKKDISWPNMAYHKEPHDSCANPEKFEREKFLLITESYQKIDVWEASLTGKIR